MPVADDHRRSSPAVSGPPDRESLIDTLLMGGLDEYFSGRYERAIQVWSRVFFLDRSHARARAYIDRARGALAERQREAEARAGREGHEGAHVLAAGPLQPDRIGPHATRGRAPAVETLQVHGALAARAATPAGAPDEALGQAARRPARRHVHVVLVGVAGLVLFIAGYTVAARDRLAEWWSADAPQAAGAALVPAAPARMSAEAALNLARQAIAASRFDEARRALALIPADDPVRKQADALLAELQLAIRGQVSGATASPGTGVAAGAHLR